jgi:hypothetical protein
MLPYSTRIWLEKKLSDPVIAIAMSRYVQNQEHPTFNTHPIGFLISHILLAQKLARYRNLETTADIALINEKELHDDVSLAKTLLESRQLLTQYKSSFGKVLISLVENKALWDLGSNELRGILGNIALWLPLHFRKLEQLQSIQTAKNSFDLQVLLKNNQPASAEKIKDTFTILSSLSTTSRGLITHRGRLGYK